MSYSTGESFFDSPDIKVRFTPVPVESDGEPEDAVVPMEPVEVPGIYNAEVCVPYVQYGCLCND